MAGKKPSERYTTHKIGTTSDEYRPLDDNDLVVIQDVSELDPNEQVRVAKVKDVIQDYFGMSGEKLSEERIDINKTIDDGSITETKYADESIATEKLQTGIIKRDHIQDGEVTFDKLGEDVMVQIRAEIVEYLSGLIGIVKVATPVIAPNAGEYLIGQAVSITCSQAGASIYYTTDGSIPTFSSTLYAGTIIISNDVTIKAIAILDGYADSNIATSIFTVAVAATPAISLLGDAYFPGEQIELSCETTNASIYYTRDGSDPDENSQLYEDPILLDSDLTIKAIAIKSGYINSQVATESYLIKLKVIKSGNQVKSIVKLNGQYGVYSFDYYSGGSGQYQEHAKWFATDDSGSKDTGKIEFSGGDCTSICVLFGGTIFGNHALMIGQKVTFTAAHGFTAADIGREMVRTSDNKRFVIYGICDSTKLYLLSQQPTSWKSVSVTDISNNNVLALDGNKTVSGNAGRVQLYSGIKHIPTINIIDTNDEEVNITNDGTWHAKKLTVTDLGMAIHPRNFYEFLVQNTGYLSNILTDVISPYPAIAIVTMDTFLSPVEGHATPSIVRIQDLKTNYTVYSAGFMIVDKVLQSNAASGGVDAEKATLMPTTERFPLSCRAYLPPMIQTYDSQGRAQPSRLMGAFMDQIAPDGKLYHIEDHDDEFGANGKQSLGRRMVWLSEDKVYGMQCGIIPDTPDDNIAARYIKDYDNLDKIVERQPLANKTLISSTFSASPIDQTMASYKKFQVNMYADNCSCYNYYEYNGAVYLDVDFHESTPEGYKIPIPTKYLGYDCSIIEKTDSILITEEDTSRVFLGGVGVSYEKDVETAPYGFISFKLKPHIVSISDADYTAFINRLAINPDTTRQGHIKDVFEELKDMMLWQYLDCLWIPGLGDNDSRFNLLSSDYTLTPLVGGTPAFEVDKGWLSSGNKGFSTNYNPYGNTKKYKHNSCSMGCYIRFADASNTGCAMGSYNSSVINAILPRDANHKIAVWPNKIGSHTPGIGETELLGKGMYSYTIHDGSVYIYKNGKQRALSSIVPITLANVVIDLMYITSMGYKLLNGQLSSAWIGGGELSMSKQATLYNIIQKYMTAVGNQV